MSDQIHLYHEEVMEEINELYEMGYGLADDELRNAMLKSIAKSLGRIADILDLLRLKA